MTRQGLLVDVATVLMEKLFCNQLVAGNDPSLVPSPARNYEVSFRIVSIGSELLGHCTNARVS